MEARDQRTMYQFVSDNLTAQVPPALNVQLSLLGEQPAPLTLHPPFAAVLQEANEPVQNS